MVKKTDKEKIQSLRAENRKLREEIAMLREQLNTDDGIKELEKAQGELDNLLNDFRKKYKECEEVIAETKVLKQELIKSADENGVKVSMRYRMKQLF